MLLIEWSASGVRCLDPSHRTWRSGATLREAIGASSHAREAVVAVNTRSAFIRTLPVPNVSGEQMHRIVALKLVPLVPFQPGDYVFGFRLGAAAKGGRTAVVGAVRTEIVRDVLTQAKECGIRVQSIVPLAFGSWLASRAHGFRDGAVVEQDGEFLNVDIVRDGELCYSRSLPLPTTEAARLAEIERTFTMAEQLRGPILALGPTFGDIPQKDPKLAIEFLGDRSAVERLLFSLELPETSSARARRKNNAAMQRALVATVAAVALGAYEYTSRQAVEKRAAQLQVANGHQIVAARKEEAAALEAERSAEETGKLIHTAFHPAQSFSDVLNVLATPTKEKVWLNGVTLERGRPVVLRGVATSGKELAAYLDELSTGDRFRSLRVLSATNGAIGKKPIVQFSLTGWVVGNLPIEALASREVAK